MIAVLLGTSLGGCCSISASRLSRFILWVHSPQSPAMERSQVSLHLGLQWVRLYRCLVCGIPDSQSSGYRDGRKALSHLAAFHHPDYECRCDNSASFAGVELG